MPAPDACPTGYAHPGYSGSLAEFGTPRHLPLSDGWVLEREIAGGAGRDAIGPYPLFACGDWSQLHADLDAIGTSLVSLALVADPFGDYSHADLERCFPDRLVPFKDHYVVDLGEGGAVGSRHHRYYARRALKHVEVELVEAPGEAFADEWTALYATLVDRHRLAGIKAFSRTAFARQLALPGTVVVLARAQGEAVGAQIWYVQGDVAYSHLTAVNARGYELRATYALYGRGIEGLRGRVRWLDLGAGAGAGTAGSGEDGLTSFKRGWATGTRPAWFCGRIFDRQRYAAAAGGAGETSYFPAYRSGEFG